MIENIYKNLFPFPFVTWATVPEINFINPIQNNDD